MSELPASEFYWSSSMLTHSYTFLVDTLELHVRSPAFDRECMYSKAIGRGPPSDDSDSDDSDHSSLLQHFFRSLRLLQARGPPLLFRYPGSQTPGSQVDLPDVQGCLHSALGAGARSSSYA